MRLAISLYLLLLAVVAALAVAGSVIVWGRGEPDDAVDAIGQRHAYDFPRWELRHFFGKPLFQVGHLFDAGPSPQEADALVQRYFQLAAEIARLERTDPQSRAASAQERLSTLRRERRQIENRVEDVLEGRISDLLDDQGLTITPPLFDDIELVFPPVDFEFDNPPRVLATSPRDRILLDRSYPLAHGLDLDRIQEIEAEAEASGVSALVVATGGVATYPSVIPELSDLPRTLKTAIHEWLHQYLSLHPLGQRYFASNELRTLNETVANLAAAELAADLLEGDVAPEPAAAPAAGFDFAKEMWALRLQVEELLAGGEVEAAERLMEERRQLFAENGYYIRRINQAYFAFHGSYADAPASIDPIGPKLQALRQRLGSVGEFVRTVAQFADVDDLDRALAQAEAASLPRSRR